MYVLSVELYDQCSAALHVKVAKYFEIFWKTWPNRKVTWQINAKGDFLVLR